MNDNEVRKAPDALERVPEMLDTPPNRYHCISKPLSVCWGRFLFVKIVNLTIMVARFGFYFDKMGKMTK